MLDKMTDIGRSFDWITPMLAQIQNIINGPSHTLLIPEASGWSGREIGRMLRRHGVKYWGMMIVKHTLMLTVRQKQARWADYLLQREGIPLLNPMPSSQPAAPGGQTAPPSGAAPRQARHGGLLDDLNGLVDSMADRLGL